MTASTWLLAGPLLAGAVAVAWPSARRRPVVMGVDGTARRVSGSDRATVVHAATVARASTWCAGRPRRAMLLAGGGAIVVGWTAAGPVAAAVVGAYTALATRAWLRRGSSNVDPSPTVVPSKTSARSPPTSAPVYPPPAQAPPGPQAGMGDVRLGELTAAVWRLAERTGVPTADLVERIEADARAGDRARASAVAQAAGARATALMLAGLPVGGIALGYGIGVDPLRVLLHSPVGAGCAVGTVILQVVGLAWTDRLVAGPPPAAIRSRVTGPRSAWRRSARRRLGRVTDRPVAPPRRRDTGPLLAAAAGAAVALLVGGWWGVPVGVAVAAGTHRVLRRMEPPAVRADRLRAAADLPLAADLLAAALRAGAPTDLAAEAVADALGGPFGERLHRVARSLRLGGEPAEAWAHLVGVAGAERLVTAAVRSTASGGALAGALARLADDLRADRSVAAEAAARRAGVLIVLPLGLCFLPAFVLAGLVPVVVAVLGDVL